MRSALLILFLFLCGFASKATHIIGGNFEVTPLGGNQFLVNLTIFRDCSPGSAILGDMRIAVFDGATNAQVSQTITPVPQGNKLTLGDWCYSPPDLCVEEYTYLDTITLADNPSGYFLSTQICCRNYIIDNIVNPGSTGMTWAIKIANPALQNTSPKLGPYPSEGFLCLNELRFMDLKATDPDGDSLYYQLVTPYNSPSSGPIMSPPYQSVTWKTGYSANNAIPGNPSLEIDPVSGMLKCKASQIGVYVFAYSVSEYRNNVKIGETRRDMQLQVLPNCGTNYKPTFFQPQDSVFTLSATEDICVPVLVVDSNSTDSILLTSYYTTNAEELVDKPNTLYKIGQGTISDKVCYTASCVDVGNASWIDVYLEAYSYNCALADTVSKKVRINLEMLPKDTEGLFPNVFTPNADGINDYFSITREDVIPCIVDMEIHIFNRWGKLVYHNVGETFSWDGTFEGHEVSAGVYYFIISGSYSSQNFSYKNFLTLIR